MIAEISAFLVALGSHWLALATGVASLIVSLIEKVRQAPLAKKALWAVAVFCAGTAAYLSWADQYREVQRLTGEATRPYFAQSNSAFEPVLDLNTGTPVGYFLAINLTNVQRNPAKNARARLLVMPYGVDVRATPIADLILDSANDIGQGGPLKLNTPAVSTRQ